MSSPQGKPDPTAWLRAYARVQIVADGQILQVIADSQDRIRQDIIRITKATTGSTGDAVQIAQMQRIRQALMQEQADLFRRLGNVTAARRLDAAAAALTLSGALDEYILSSLGKPLIAKAVTEGLLRGLARTTEVALARMGYSYTNLSERIYKTNLWMSGRLDNLINQALARGLTAQEFSREAMSWFDPNTPGGVRYAALRLARSEINNAYHAVAVAKANEEPWVTAMKWHLSSSHPKADQCDEYAHEDHAKLGPGVFPKADVPRKPHPHCYCYVTPVQVDEDEFLDNLTKGKYDSYIDKQRAKASGPVEAAPKIPSLRDVAQKAKQAKVDARKAELADIFASPDRLADFAGQRLDKGMKVRGGSDAAGTIRSGLEHQIQFVPGSVARLGEIRGGTRASVYGTNFNKRYGPQTGAFYRDADFSINFSPSWVSERAIIDESFERFTWSDGSSWFSRSEHGSLFSTTSHEFGHHVEVMAGGLNGVGWSRQAAEQFVTVLKQEFPGLIGSPWLGNNAVVHYHEFDAWFQLNAPVFDRVVSQYGSKNIHEFIAEVWAEYTTGGSSARGFIVNIGEVLEELAEAGARNFSRTFLFEEGALI